MGMATILVMWPGPNIQTVFPPLPGDCIWNLIEIGPVVSEKKSFENVGDGRQTNDRQQHFNYKPETLQPYLCLHRYGVTKCAPPEICSLFVQYMHDQTVQRKQWTCKYPKFGQTGLFEETVQTQMLYSLIRSYTVCNSISIFLTYWKCLNAPDKKG